MVVVKAQEPSRTLITNKLTESINKQGFEPEYRITSTVPLSSGGIAIYGTQTYQGIDVFQANFVLTAQNADVLNVKQSFIVNIEKLIPSTSFGLSAVQAVGVLTNQKTKVAIGDVKEIKAGSYELNNDVLSDETILIRKQWVLVGSVVVPAYSVALYEKDHQHWFDTRIDANTGHLINQNDWVVACQVRAYGKSQNKHLPYSPLQTGINAAYKKSAGASYNVFAIPLESPNHGTRSIEVDPSDADASPFGWHDTNGADGPEYTITRGNNVYASEDKNDDNIPGFSPDGGPLLTFNDTFNINNSAALYTNAAITNLFYWNNIMHDVWWHYGFDEESGNFQSNNYGNGGLGGDFVSADAQDGSGTNNANMATPPDGINPRMQMFLWNTASAGDYFMVNSPTSIAGKYISNRAGFGPSLSAVPIVGNLVLVQDGTTEPEKGCDALTNATALSGNIALVERRGCNFTVKVKNAQNAGARAVVIYSDDNQAPILMGGVDNTITIPAVLITNTSGLALRNALASQTVSVSLYDSSNLAPNTFDSDFDNGVIAHEYGHGISNRLTGGPAASGCLSNEEQMGEGWSDFFGLVVTHQPGDLPTKSRGIGTYVRNEPITGGGIRPFPYSTDLSASPYTYDDVKRFSVPHGVGSVWCSMLWDLYWAMIDKHGYDADIYNGTGGNNMAMQLVIDGLKLQKCNPGFADGRDAIILADKLTNNGENELLIWQVFARRGLGADADQGSSNDRGDGNEDFTLPKYLLGDIVLEKTTQDEAHNDSTLIYTIKAENRTVNTIKNIVLRDTLNSNVVIDAASLQCGATFENGIITYTIDSLVSKDSLVCSYSVTPRFPNFSTTSFVDSIENGENGWTKNEAKGSVGFRVSTNRKNSGNSSWYAINEASENDYTLSKSFDLSGLAKPTFTFYHWYLTEETWDGAVVEIKVNGTWIDAGDYFIENGYNDVIQTNPASSISGRAAFTGNSGGFVKSSLDLSSFINQTIEIRFRMASDGAARDEGWYIDDIILRDAILLTNYATATYSGNRSRRSGTLTFINGIEENVGVEELYQSKWEVYPNPATDYVNISTDLECNYIFELRTVSGALMTSKNTKGNTTIDLRGISKGVYLVNISQKDGVSASYKIIVE